MAEYQGNLYIFVDQQQQQQQQQEPDCARSEIEPGNVFELRTPGESLWYLSGWAVGRSAQNRYCARTSLSKLRNFETFSEAMDFVRSKRKARPWETFHFVYELEGQKSIVTGLEQIQQRDKRRLDPDGHGLSGLVDHQKLETLTEKVGKIVATNALVLFRTLVKEGEAAARARFSAATYERLHQVLLEAALVEGGVCDPLP